MGGIVAQDGFDYQLWYALGRIPGWLTDPAFEGLVIEGLEDVEARFFAPQAPHGRLLERYQAKMAQLSRSDLAEVLDAFAAFERAFPETARLHALVTPALPATLKWVEKDPERVRRARPFYAPFKDVAAASDAKLRADLIAAFGADHGALIAEAVDISTWAVDRSRPEGSVVAAFREAFPTLDVGVLKLKAGIDALYKVASDGRGQLLSRAQLLDCLEGALGVALVPNRSNLVLHLRSDRDGDCAGSLQLDTAAFAGGPVGFPPPTVWQAGMLDPLAQTARWAREGGISRIVLSGSYRLTTGFLLGWAFRSATGFEIDIPTRSGPWPTDAHGLSGQTPPAWQISRPSKLLETRLVVAIGVVRDPRPDIEHNLAGADSETMLTALLPDALTSAEETQASVRIVKAAIGETVAQLRPSAIDLYLVGPAAYSVALGHRWNGLPPTQLFEFLAADGSYRPTALLG